MYSRQSDPGFWGQVPADFLRILVDERLVDGITTSVWSLGDPHDPETTCMVMFHMPPGGVLPRHSHPCDRFEVVVQGSLISEGVEYRPGDVMQTGPETAYGPHEAGPEGFTVLELFSRMAGATTITWQTARGPKRTDLLEYARREAARAEAAAEESSAP